MLVKWPGKVKPGTRSNHISAFWDILPTFADITGAHVPEGLDGISFLPTLLGRKGQKEHDYLYWEFHEQGGKVAVRMGNWKAVSLDVDNNKLVVTELYDLSNDIGETDNIADAHTDIVKKIEGIMKQVHVKSEDFPFKWEIQTN